MYYPVGGTLVCNRHFSLYLVDAMFCQSDGLHIEVVLHIIVKSNDLGCFFFQAPMPDVSV